MTLKPETRRANYESRLLARDAFRLARALDILNLFIQEDEVRDLRIIEKLRTSERIIWVTRGETTLPITQGPRDVVVRIPATDLTRTSQMNLGLFLAVLNGDVELDESVICLSGVVGSKRLDTLRITSPGRDFPWFQKQDLVDTRKIIATRHLARLIAVALRLAAEGREGHPIGTTFVLGEEKEIAPHLRQLILNPCAGHPRKDRNIHNPSFFETLREFAALDGAFVISEKGVVESAGTYLDAPLKKSVLRRGLGARHAAAAAITAVTHAIAIAVSASSGTVTVFHEGKAMLELEKPRMSPHRIQSSRHHPARK
jgi:diadenylate cyclase